MIKKLGFIALMLLGLLILGVFLFAKDVDITLSENQVQAAIDKQINADPIRSRGIELTLNSAAIDFKANNTAAIVVDFLADGFGYTGSISGNLESGIRYDAPEIFLNNIVPIEMSLILDQETDGKLQDIKNVTSDYLKRQKEQMLSEEAKQSMDNIVGRNEESLKKFALESTYKFFETLPIYDLNDTGVKGSLASLALKNVKFTETEAIITLSPVQALIKILTFCSFLVLSIWSFFGFYIPGRRSKLDTEVPESR